MPRILDVLEQESRTVDLEQGDFERLLVRRERQQRNRRLRAGAVGVIVALAMGIIFVRSLPSGGIPADRSVEPRPAPAASGSLAYVLDFAVYVADPDGSNAVKIAKGISLDDCASTDGFLFWAEGPMWSPDGRYLAYHRYPCPARERNGQDVVIADAAGNVLAAFPAVGWDIGWSPDSTRVAVWDTLFGTVGVYGVDGIRQAQLTMPPGWTPSGDHDPRWMPGGTSVWVENWELPLDGSAPRELPSRGGDPYATYSPDGSLVAYNNHGSLMVARSDGSEPREVFDRPGGGSHRWGTPWSPTGDRIAFASDGTEYGTELHVVDVATGSVALLAEAERGTSFDAIGFSPSGDRVLFFKLEGRAKSQWGAKSLWSIGVDGSDPRLVVAGAYQGEWLSR